MYYIIKLNDGDYYEYRGGHDWGRTSLDAATRFSTDWEAERLAEALRIFGAVVEEV